MSMKRQFVWLSVACLLTITVWFGLAFRPAHSQLNTLRDDVATTKQKVTDLEAKVQKLLALQRNSSGARDQAQRLVGSLPPDPKVSDFILQVQDAANAAGIDFLSIAPSLPAVPADIAASTASAVPSESSSGTAAKPTPEEVAAAAAAAAANPVTRLRAISVQIKADGEFFEIEDFVLKMERLARALRIDDFALSVAGEDQANKLTAAMKVQMFMLAPQAAAPNGQTTQGTSEAS